MNKSIKKKIIPILIFVVAASVIGVILFFAFKESSEMSQPFKDINKSEISKVYMCNNYGVPKAELDDKELDEFIGLLREIKTGKTLTKEEVSIDGFSTARIKIEYTNGDTKVLGPNNDIFCIDGTPYESEKESCNALEKMRERILNNTSDKTV